LRNLQRPIFQVPIALEIFQRPFFTLPTASPKVLRLSLLSKVPLKFFKADFPWEIGPEIFQDRFPAGKGPLKFGEGDFPVANRP
jgi:hypothetical protein